MADIEDLLMEQWFFDSTGDDESWRDRSECAAIDPELWFPKPGGASRIAKRYCSRCPVNQECLAFALKARPGYGVWGGLHGERLKKAYVREDKRLAEEARGIEESALVS